MEDDDRKVLEKAGITIIEHQKGQFGLFHKMLDAEKFVWYPRKGTLMYESKRGIRNMGSYWNPNEVADVIKNIADETLPEGW